MLARERDGAAAGKVAAWRVSAAKLLELMRPLWRVYALEWKYLGIAGIVNLGNVWRCSKRSLKSTSA